MAKKSVNPSNGSSGREDHGALEPYKGGKENYAKANFLIGAKYKSSLLENKIMAYSLSKVSKGEYNSEKMVCDIPASELRMVANSNAGSFYSQLSTTALRMTSRAVGINDPETKFFDYISIITRATYKDGILHIEFNENLKDYIVGLQANYTTLNLPIMMGFTNNFAFRLYEVLKSKSYYPKSAKNSPKYGNNVFEIECGLAELKLDLGVVDSNDLKVKAVLKKTELNPDFEKAVEAAQENSKMYNSWYEFHRKVLTPAVEQINELSDMRVSYSVMRGGRGGKVYGITFLVKILDNNSSKQEVTTELTDEEKDKLIDFLGEELWEYRLKLRDLREIVNTAEYDRDRIEAALKVLKKRKEEPDNVVGFLIAAIKEGYKNYEEEDLDDEVYVPKKFRKGTQIIDSDETEYELLHEEPVEIPTKKKTPSRKKKVEQNSFNQFEQNDYDFEKLEELLEEKPVKTVKTSKRTNTKKKD